MKVHFPKKLARFLLPALLLACAPPAAVIRQPPAAPAPPAEVSRTPETVPDERSNREASARELMRRGDLARALIQWEILCTLSPEAEEYQHHLSATRKLIRQKVTGHLREGEKAEATGHGDRALQEYLWALALDPLNRESLEKLRELERERILGVQLARLRKREARRAQQLKNQQLQGNGHTSEDVTTGQEGDYLSTGIALFKAGAYEESILEIRKYLSSYPTDRRALDYLERAQAALRVSTPTGNQSAGDAVAGSSTPMRAEPSPPAAPGKSVEIEAADQAAQEKAQELYEEGLRAYRSDLDRAIVLWERSLALYPQHTQAKLKLDQAYRMRSRLREIGGQ